MDDDEMPDTEVTPLKKFKLLRREDDKVGVLGRAGQPGQRQLLVGADEGTRRR